MWCGGPGTHAHLSRVAGWFLNIEFSEIRRGNVADFIAYAYWCARRGRLGCESWEVWQCATSHEPRH